LAILDLDKEIRVEADVLDYTTGGVLSTKYKDGNGDQWPLSLNY